jgi:hypothetical protein
MHPPGFHKNPEAQARCWGCNNDPRLELTEADMERARKLIADGFVSTSNRYRTVSKVHTPPFDEAMTFAAGVPAWLREEIHRAYEEQTKRWGARGNKEGVEHIELTSSEFRAFKLLGGPTA